MSDLFSPLLKVGDRIEFKDLKSVHRSQMDGTYAYPGLNSLEGNGDNRKVGVIQEFTTNDQRTLVVKDDSRDADHLIKLDEVMRKIEDLQRLDEITQAQTPLPI